MRKRILFIVLLAVLQIANAQKAIVLQEIRTTLPVNYLQDEISRKNFLSQVNTLLLRHWKMPLTDTMQLTTLDLNTGKAPALNTSFNDTSRLYLYLGIAEFQPRAFFSATNNPADSALRKTAKTVFRVMALILKADKTVMYDEKLDVVVHHVSGPGMGYESNIVFLMPKTFVELMKAAMNVLLDTTHEQGLISVGITPTYDVDDYALPKLLGQTRTQVSSTKDFRTYFYREQKQLIRFGEPRYEQIITRGRNARLTRDSLTLAIAGSPNSIGSDFVFLRQECRDVGNDKNYLVKLVTQVNPEIAFMGPERMFTGFLPQRLHYLLGDKDTVAAFIIRRNVPTENLVYPGRIYNGFDTTTVFNVSSIKTSWKLEYAYELSGSIQGHDFIIACSGGDNKLKEIYLDGSLIAIAQGKLSPEIFVVFDATLPPVLFNQLLIIAFNCFLE